MIGGYQLTHLLDGAGAAFCGVNIAQHDPDSTDG